VDASAEGTTDAAAAAFAIVTVEQPPCIHYSKETLAIIVIIAGFMEAVKVEATIEPSAAAVVEAYTETETVAIMAITIFIVIVASAIVPQNCLRAAWELYPAASFQWPRPSTPPAAPAVMRLPLPQKA
jgi:hypothetical protein